MDQREIILKAALIESTAKRAEFLEEACRSHPELRQRIELLLSEDNSPATLDSEDPNHEPTIDGVALEDQVGKKIGPYKLMEKIGEGGMGVIYVAEQSQPVRRRVAIKIIKPGMDSKDIMARFEAERQALAMMDHPNIARVLDAGATETGMPYFVMELVRGISITKFCDNHKLSSAQRLALFIDVCHAIQHAHQKGIIHRDIKPNNVLVTMNDDKPAVKVIDFGVAKAINQRLTEHTVYTRLSQMVGTPLYMSPEQVEMSGLDIDTRSDIYSLGVLLYELLTGSTPFDREQLKKAAYDEMRRIIREDEPPRPSTRISTLGDTAVSVCQSRNTEPRNLSHQLRGDLDWIVMKAMEKDRSRRYETANAFSMDVQRYLNNEPVLATPPSATYRLRKLVRRHRGAFVAATVILTLLVAGVAGTTYGLVTSIQANNVIRQQNDQLDTKNQGLVDANKSIQEKNEQLAVVNQREASERKRAESVTEFLVSSFRKVDPDQEGRDLTVLEVLNRSVEEIDEELAENPRTQADLLSAIGRSYLGLGFHADALEVFRRERELRSQFSVADDRLRLRADYNFALALYYDGKYAEAQKLCEETIKKQQAAFGESDTDAASHSMSVKAMCHSASGDVQAAIEIYQWVVQTRQEKEGEDAADTLTALNNLATAFQSDGQHEKALAIFQSNLEKCRQTLGDNDIRTIRSLARLGSIYVAMGRFEQALPLYEAALEKRRIKFGDRHPQTLESMSGLAFALRDAGQLDDVLEMLNEVLEIKRQELGREHHSTLASMNDLTRVYLELGRHAEALPLVEEAYEKTRDKLGSTSPKSVAAMNTLGMTYFLAGRPDLAVPVFEDLLKIHISTQGRDHPTTISVMNNLAMTYRNVGRPQEALPLLEETLRWRQENLDPDHPKTLISEANLASIYKSLGDLEKATALFERTVDSHRVRLGESHRQTISAVDGLIGAYLQSGKLREGLSMARAALEVSVQALGEDHPDSMRAMSTLGISLLLCGYTAKANEMLEHALELRRRNSGEVSSFTIQAITTLARARLQSSQVDEALALVRQSKQSAEEKFDANHSLALSASRVLGAAILMTGDGEAAVQTLDETAAAHVSKWGLDHPNVLKAQHQLGNAYLSAGLLNEAAATLRSVSERRTNKLGSDHLETLSSQLLLAQCLLKQQQFEQAQSQFNAIWEQKPAEELGSLLPVERELIAQTTKGYIALYEDWEKPELVEQWKETEAQLSGLPVPDAERSER